MITLCSIAPQISYFQHLSQFPINTAMSYTSTRVADEFVPISFANSVCCKEVLQLYKATCHLAAFTQMGDQESFDPIMIGPYHSAQGYSLELCFTDLKDCNTKHGPDEPSGLVAKDFGHSKCALQGLESYLALQVCEETATLVTNKSTTHDGQTSSTCKHNLQALVNIGHGLASLSNAMEVAKSPVVEVTQDPAMLITSNLAIGVTGMSSRSLHFAKFKNTKELFKSKKGEETLRAEQEEARLKQEQEEASLKAEREVQLRLEKSLDFFQGLRNMRASMRKWDIADHQEDRALAVTYMVHSMWELQRLGFVDKNTSCFAMISLTLLIGSWTQQTNSLKSVAKGWPTTRTL